MGNLHDQRENFVLRTQRNLYFTDSCSGFALGVVDILALALGVMQILALLDTHMLLLPKHLAPLTLTPVLKGGNLWCPHQYG